MHLQVGRGDSARAGEGKPNAMPMNVRNHANNSCRHHADATRLFAETGYLKVLSAASLLATNPVDYLQTSTHQDAQRKT
jgi:hypothetical protein